MKFMREPQTNRSKDVFSELDITVLGDRSIQIDPERLKGVQGGAKRDGTARISKKSEESSVRTA